MKTKFFKSWLMLCLLLVGVGQAWGAEQSATFTMKNSGQSSPVTVNGVTFTWTSSNIVVGTNNGSGFKASSNMTITIPAGKKLTAIEKGNGNTWGSGAQIDVYAGTSSSGTKITTIIQNTNTYSISSNNTGTTYYFANTSSKNAWLNTLTIKYDDNAGGGSTPGGDSGDGDSDGDDENGTLTINMSKLTNPHTTTAVTYNTYNWTSGTVSGVYNGASSSDNTSLQFNYSASGSSNYRDKQAVYNTVAVPGRITSIKMVTASGSNRTWTPYVSSSAITPANYTSATALTAKTVNSGEGTTWEVTGNNTYFYLNYTTGSASYIGDIVITYETTPAEPVQISNLLTKTSDNAKVKDVIDLSEYINKPNDYTGDITYTVTSGADKCDIEDEFLEITKAGEIVVKVSAAAAGNYLLTEGSITFTATKNELGEFLKQANISLVKDDVQNMSELLTLGKYDGTIQYQSDNEDVADVYEGVLLAYAIGSANITITAPNTEAWTGGTKTLAVTVSGKAPTILTENKTYTLIKDGTAAATTTTADDGLTVKFRSANADVARVDAAGVITAVAAGNATIYAYTEANDDFAAGEEVYATVTVVEPVITFTPAAGSFAADNTPVKVNVTGVEDYIYVTDPSIADDFDTNTDGIEIGDAETKILISATTTIRVKAYDDEDNVSSMVSATFTRKQQPNIQIEGIENGSTKNITWGDEFEMPDVTAADGAVLNYRSSAYTVAAFDGSTLNILKAGTTTITVSVAEDENFVGEEYSFTLVIAKATPTVTFTTAGNQEIFIDDTEAVAYGYTCNTVGLAVSYSSSNDNVVTVDAETGALTPVKVGTAIIYAKTPAGQDNYYVGTAQYNITVKKHDATLAWNDGEGANVNYEIGESDFAGWTATTNSDNAVTYRSSAISVATVDANTGAVTVVGKGTTTITASVAASDTYNAATSITYTITASNGIVTFRQITSINDIVEGAKYLIVQPTSQKATTTLSSKKLLSTSVTIDNSSITLDDVNTSGKPYFVQFEKSGDNWLIKASFGYIYYGGSSTDLASAANLPATVSNAYKWNITVENGEVYMQNVSANTRYLMFNSSNELRPYVPGDSYSYPTLYAQTATTISISAFENTTLSLKVPYIMPAGLVGKTISAAEGSDGAYTLTLTEKYVAGDVVPAGEALLIKGAQGNYTALAGTTSAAKTAYPNNLLVAEYTKQDTKFLTSYDNENADDYYYYKLSTSGGENFGWYYGAEDGAPFLMSNKQRAYLVIEKETAQSLVGGMRIIDLENGSSVATSVENVETNESVVKFIEDGKVYILRAGVVHDVLGNVVR